MHVFVVDSQPLWEELEEELQELDCLEDHCVICQHYPVSVDLALELGQFLLDLFAVGVVGVQSLYIFRLPFQFLPILLKIHKSVNGATDPNMQKLQSQEEKLRNSAKLLLASDLRCRFRANDISPHTGSILMIHEVGRVDTFPFLVLHVSNSFTQTQQT